MSSESDAKRIKEFYASYHDRIADKRFNSPYWLRRYAHRTIYERNLNYVQPGQRVLDAGCGEGVLSILMAQKGASVIGIDISAPNVEAAQKRAGGLGVAVSFIVGDAEELPFADNSFDLVVSSHVIEHLPDPIKGLRELHRATRGLAVIAMPTCLNPAAWVLLGGDNYWTLSKRSLFAIPLGFLRTVAALLQGSEGPQEGYAGHNELPHVFRFPWVVIRKIQSVGFRIEHYGADSLLIPYIAQYFPLARWLQQVLDRYADKAIVKYFGIGSHVLCRKG